MPRLVKCIFIYIYMYMTRFTALCIGGATTALDVAILDPLIEILNNAYTTDKRLIIG